ncbi:MAG TPA: response regulator [Bryobacteraceae bacterium]|jgi:CheY-like chemotaxis protein
MRKIRLLVVEDDPAYRYLIRKAFSDRSDDTTWDVTVATDGEKAVHLLFEEEDEGYPLPDIILLDWNLPGVSGNQVLRRLKEDERLKRIPVLVFSTSTDDETVHAAYDDYANGYITKPASMALLATVVETIERFWTGVAHLPRASRRTLLD